MPVSPVSGPVRRGWRIRPAEPGDVPAVDGLIRELAAYEREPDAVLATVTDLAAALFGPEPRVHCHVAEVDPDIDPDVEADIEADGNGADEVGPRVVGMALWFVTYSTWRGRHGIWLEDLFVSPEHRRLGLGRALLSTLAGICVQRGYPRMEWTVLDWNEPAHDFYREIGASPLGDWTTWRLPEKAIEEVSQMSP